MFFNLITMRLQTNNKLWQNVTMYYTISINVFIFLRIVLLFSSTPLVSFFDIFYHIIYTFTVPSGLLMLKGGISMVAADTKTLLLQSTSRIISERGFGRLTLDAVCKEAGVSKGGLLYHFPNKEALIQGLNYYVLQNTQQYIHEEEKNSKSFTEAYLRATIKSLDASNEDLKIFPGLIASLS